MKRARFHAFAAFRIHQRTSTAATTTPATTSIQPSLPISTPGSCAVVNLHNLPPPASTFYRRSLPPILTSFNSSEGKKLFKESLAKGTAEAFLHLSGNLAHQSEPAFCGLGSLAIVLNALEIDPNRPWKGAWRWYDETLLDCCSPLETIKQKGITFDEFASLAKCNGLSLVAMRVLPDENEMGGGGGGSGNASTFKTLEASGTATSAATVPRVASSPGTTAASLEQFKKDLKLVCSDAEGRTQMVVSFSRKVLHQTGDGHFSPIGAFHEESGMVLVLDVARFKYPSYFVHVDVLYDAMKPLDKVTGKGRGYFLLSKKHEAGAGGKNSNVVDIFKRGGNYKSVIEAHLKTGKGSHCVTSGCSHDVAEMALVKITPLSLSKTEGVVEALTKTLPEALEGAGRSKDDGIRKICSLLIGSQNSPGVLAMSFRKPAVDLAVSDESESAAAAHQKAHDDEIALLVQQIESMPIYAQVKALSSIHPKDSLLPTSDSAKATPDFQKEETNRLALSALLVMSLPGSVYLSLQNSELRTFFMEAKYTVSQGPKSRLKSEVERLEGQLTSLINKL